MLEKMELQVFLVLADELHFGRTAERLSISAGRVSQIVKALEERVGARLFQRSSRSVALTSIGCDLHEDLQIGYDRIQQGLARAAEAAGRPAELLRVGYVGALAGQVVHRAAQSFGEDKAGGPVRPREVQVVDALGRLRGSEVDMLVISLPVSAPDIVVGPVLFSEPRMLAVPAEAALASRESVTLEDLVEIVLLRPPHSTPGSWPSDRDPRITPSGAAISGGIRVETFQEALQQTAAGRGAVIVGAQAQRFYSRPDVVYVPFRDAPPIEWAAVWLRTDDASRLRTFAQVARTIGHTEGPQPQAGASAHPR
ncbi:LysR family transcriptional regulator [Streptomyces sp. NPDC057217]|uniref:LysR family transcriptional regulator n=1 Tax=unclassified Streptomyces TaxID=2593676 RepID=UPI00362EF558